MISSGDEAERMTSGRETAQRETAQRETAGRGTKTQRGDTSEEHRAEIGRARAAGLETGWTVASYMLAGLVSYGAIGWLLARVTHVQLLFPLGMIFGIAVSVGYVIYRFGRHGTDQIKTTLERNDR
jgi:ATP synthase protein I